MNIRKLAGETLIYGTGFILGKVLNYLLIAAYLTRKFDGETEQYGLYTDFYFYVALILVLLTLRMETTFFRFGSKEGAGKKSFSQAVLALFCTATLWMVFVIFYRSQIAEFLSYPGYGRHVLVLGTILALDVLVAIPFAGLRLANKPIKFAGLKLTGIIVNILAVLFFLEIAPWMNAAWYENDDRLLYVFFANLLGSLTVFCWFAPDYLKMKWRFDWAVLKPMLRYTWPLIIVGIAGVINQSSYITFQKYLLPNSLEVNLGEGGVFAAAARIAILMSLFTTAFNYAAEPFFFQNAEDKNAPALYADVAKAFALVGSILFLGILLYIDLVQLILGESFRGGMSVVPILLLAFFFLGLYYNFSIWYKLTDRTRYGALIAGGGAVITIALNVILIQKMEVIGSAWAALACYLFMAITCLVIGKRFFPVPYQIGRILLYIGTAVAVYFLSEWLRQWSNGLGSTLLINTLLLIGFVAFIYWQEKKLIDSVLFKKSKSA